MTVKEQVLLILLENKNDPVSGQELANRLNCSRGAVWKAVKELEAEGYEISGVNKKGYTLKRSGDNLSRAFIEERLGKSGAGLKVETYAVIDSTNSLLKRYASNGETGDMLVASEEQTAGRGRRGRSFYSPKGTGVYMSFLLHPTMPAGEAARLTTLAAVATAEAIETVTGETTEIKWVNDIRVRGKKVCGILTEAQTSMEDGTLDHCIVGIGINLYEPCGGFPDEIKDVAGAVCREEKKENLKNEIVSEVALRLLKYYSELSEKTYLEGYRKRCFCIGRDVCVMTADHEERESNGPDRVHAHVLGIDDECHLHVRYNDGFEEYLSSGEISIKV
ncbi:MAG: biotin--[Lachnospiraceae bacterium]|nr:biotin--[acetyl-CoA-carboxylase] ligase [Lachnospiraceae bacterium]